MITRKISNLCNLKYTIKSMRYSYQDTFKIRAYYFIQYILNINDLIDTIKVRSQQHTFILF